MRAALTFLLVLGTCLTAGAQHLYDANWLFGYKCGLSFSHSPPQPLIGSPMVAWEASASISNEQGELQFYTNGNRLWNKQHQVMENGTSLSIGNRVLGTWYGDTLMDYGTSSTQGMLILPSITDSNQYLIFTQNAFPDTGLRVTTVDITFNNGLGKVIYKNQAVYQGHWFSEKLTACRHANGRDWWLVSLEQQSNRYSVLLYNSQGIVLHHIDTVGAVIAANGQMAFSHLGNHIGVVSPFGKIQILNFDRCNGVLSENCYIGYNVNSYYQNNFFYGACFSPDESKFYVSAGSGRVILQFAKSSALAYTTIPDTIWNNQAIDTTLADCQRIYLNQMQLGPDGKIYCSVSPVCTMTTPWSNYSHNLSVINKPDEAGAACEFEPASVFVGNAPHYNLLGLPNLPNYNLGRLIGSPCDTLHTALTAPEEPRFSSNLYPNPNGGSFTLTLDAERSGSLQLLLTDVTGRVLLTKALPERKAVYQLNLGLSSGAYNCIVLDNNKRVKSLPFIVINE